LPLRLLHLFADQISADIKEYFEQELIGKCDNLYSLLTILSSNKKPIESNSKRLLKERLSKEYLIEKRQFSNREQQDKVQRLEKMKEILNLED